ncbi:hypothetical protein PanWU01x14_180460 [Parasponia andersonii]|uniref:Uncharacterized protein n=1 Tax=Parasponia andersonii TaxID=3476 RepID=A0A2P5C6I1_PARAD|nr:hypothetical protein PanWU01x14_180460 [Parasponia andersonii]
MFASRPHQKSHCRDHVARRLPEKMYEEERAAQPTNLPADLKNDRTMGIISRNKILADGPRKYTKRNELRNQKLASRPRI